MPQVTHLYPPTDLNSDHVDIRKDEVEEAALLSFLERVIAEGAHYIVVDRDSGGVQKPKEASND